MWLWVDSHDKIVSSRLGSAVLLITRCRESQGFSLTHLYVAALQSQRYKKTATYWLSMELSCLSGVTLFVLGPLLDIVLLLLFLAIGLAIIILLAKVLLFALPAAIIALVVWFLTGNLLWAGVAFLVVALISLLRR